MAVPLKSWPRYCSDAWPSHRNMRRLGVPTCRTYRSRTRSTTSASGAWSCASSVSFLASSFFLVSFAFSRPPPVVSALPPPSADGLPISPTSSSIGKSMVAAMVLSSSPTGTGAGAVAGCLVDTSQVLIMMLNRSLKAASSSATSCAIWWVRGAVVRTRQQRATKATESHLEKSLDFPQAATLPPPLVALPPLQMLVVSE
mmetsp:Transcript_109931/g.319921  ORF Transcript_109931/g.319921 Transcript_109931/m.319921 type:complete len:200 (+) Transcript_109931:899-1498(+)